MLPILSSKLFFLHDTTTSWLSPSSSGCSSSDPSYEFFFLHLMAAVHHIRSLVLPCWGRKRETDVTYPRGFNDLHAAISQIHISCLSPNVSPITSCYLLGSSTWVTYGHLSTHIDKTAHVVSPPPALLSQVCFSSWSLSQ